MPHDFDSHTFFCVRCGASREAVADGLRGEGCPEGIIGISHQRCLDRWEPIFNSILDNMSLSNSYTRPPDDAA